MLYPRRHIPVERCAVLCDSSAGKISPHRITYAAVQSDVEERYRLVQYGACIWLFARLFAAVHRHHVDCLPPCALFPFPSNPCGEMRVVMKWWKRVAERLRRRHGGVIVPGLGSGPGCSLGHRQAVARRATRPVKHPSDHRIEALSPRGSTLFHLISYRRRSEDIDSSP